MDVAVTEQAIKITLLSAGPISPSLEVSTGEEVLNLERGSPVTINRAKGVVRVRDSKPHSSSSSRRAYDHTHICLLLLVSFCLYLLMTSCRQ